MTAMNDYRLLGGSGLRVSPLALGTMTFGSEQFGSDEADSRAVLDRYLESGGNFIDTADVYSSGRSEELLGKFLGESGLRDSVVLATKFSQGDRSADPNRSGNGRKNLIASLDASLRRLGTDYIDLYWVHIWDTVTPVEEVMSTFDALVRAGIVRAFGFSNVPSWYAAKAQVTARWRGWEPVAALQMEYSLANRYIETEYVGAALDLGIGLIPWGPLASGFLSGKYRREGDYVTGTGRLEDETQRMIASMTGGFGDRHWAALAAAEAVAAEIGRPIAQVALNWVTRRSAIASTIIGARNTDQLEQNLAALEFELTDEQMARLDEASDAVTEKLHLMWRPEIQRQFMTPDYTVAKEPATYRPRTAA
ncbi:aldo/keto reductase [Glycomyces salinus]|uniref:aldo/keto reductase n=1 Tax=Glycomyces salinus TaxID=980294 RepID=UPI0018EC3BF6|nr:aldo/keto reductase [Glycomyces salinus]